VYELQAEDASLADQPIVQPTGQQMLRYWQAYISILNTQYPHEVERFLSVSRPVTQVRLSVLATSVGALLIMLFCVLFYRVADLRLHASKRLMLPNSSFGWVMQATHERQQRQGGKPMLLSSPSVFVSQHYDLMLIAGRTPDGHWEATRIYSASEPGMGPDELKSLEK
jgi:hypothetical protein